MYDDLVTDRSLLEREELFAGEMADVLLSESGIKFQGMPEYHEIESLAAEIFRALDDDFKERFNAGFQSGDSYIDLYENHYIGDHNGFLERVRLILNNLGQEVPNLDHEIGDAIYFSVMYILRSIMYASRAYSLSQEDGVSAVYVSSPGRLKSIAKYLNVDTLEREERINLQFAKHVEKLKFPTNGYNMSILSREMNPLKHSGLANYLGLMHPRDAIEAAQRLRERDDVKILRRSWARIIQALGSSTCEEATTMQAVYDTTAGTINQSMNQTIQHFYVLSPSQGKEEPYLFNTEILPVEVRDAQASLNAGVNAALRRTKRTFGGWLWPKENK